MAGGGDGVRIIEEYLFFFSPTDIFLTANHMFLGDRLRCEAARAGRTEK